MGAEQRDQLRRLANFSFRRHPSINLPERRLNAIEEQVNRHARELLSLPRVQVRTAKQGSEPER